MNFLRNVNPVGAIADFRMVFKEAGSNRWRFAALALLCTVGVFSIMKGESWKKARPLPEITYITSWPEHRTDAETKQFIAENQRRKDAQEERLREYDKVGQDMWMSLGRATGVNVDKIKAEADADKAKAVAEAKSKAEAMIQPDGRVPIGR
ncbi:hypothetical protein [Novosphingobium sp.]|uniref:hypothetical protein n=1 Tax=Novosphingobium sp. TaxID=1874826 RepID=UPI0025F9CEC8|nr:hypothetical protein [Novosphingobium sp.]